MPARRNDEKAKELYDLYQQGKTLRQLSEMYGISDQSIHKMFVRRGWLLRNKKAEHHQYFNGKKYACKPSGYYVSTDRGRTLMHRDVWEFHNGAIPDGYQVHHMNGERGDNSIGNLMLVDMVDHARRHNQARMHLHVCPHCGGLLFPDG